MYDVIIIGAGIAGLAAALRFRKRGKKVLVLEKNNYAGGKIQDFELMGYRWDKGPSLFTMPQLVDDLYELFDKKPSDYYQYKKEEESCRYFFSDTKPITFYTEHNRLEDELKNKLGIESALVMNYLKRSAAKYDAIGEVFLETAIHKPSHLPIGSLLKKIPQLLQTELFSSLHAVNKKWLKDDKLVQIFDRYATYNGSNPYRASGILSMIPHLEQNIGTYFPENGMRSIIEGLSQLAKEEGVEFQYNEQILSCTPIQEGFDIRAKQNYHCKQLICAIDHLNFYEHILKDEQLLKQYKKQERSSSALIFYWGMKQTFPELGLHNIFFSEDYKQEFELIFDKKEIPFEGTIYIHISSKSNPKDAPSDCENWFVMLNVPAGIHIDIKTEKLIKKAILKRLETLLNKEIEPYIVCEDSWTPEGIAQDTGAVLGALYGASSNSKMAALKRHSNFSKKYKGLYFCGGTAHPGGGIPLSLQSAYIVEQLAP